MAKFMNEHFSDRNEKCLAIETKCESQGARREDKYGKERGHRTLCLQKRVKLFMDVLCEVSQIV